MKEPYGMRTAAFAVGDYDLEATLNSGQAFRWTRCGESWASVVRGQWVRLRRFENVIQAEVALPTKDWAWLRAYLQLDLDLASVLRTFPHDGPMKSAMETCRGLRLLRQEPWECLASFIVSSTKQIVQIRQVISALCSRFGAPVAVPQGIAQEHAFPSPMVIASLEEADLRACKMGFRAPYLLETARQIAANPSILNLEDLSVEAARSRLMEFPGVGRKIADCVLLFAYGMQAAFPVDVWVARALRDLYFRGQRQSLAQLNSFALDYFGPFAGYAQQYLFHWMRTRPRGEG